MPIQRHPSPLPLVKSKKEPTTKSLSYLEILEIEREKEIWIERWKEIESKRAKWERPIEREKQWDWTSILYMEYN